MKKILTLIALVAFVCTGAMAQTGGTITVTSNNQYWNSNEGSYTSAKVWTSSASGKPVLTVTGASAKNSQAWNQTNGVLMCRNNNSDGGKVTLTLSIAGNYRITGFDITGMGAFSLFTTLTITSNGQTATCTGTSVADQVPATLNVTDLYTTSTTIEIRETQNAARGIVTDFVVYYVEHSDFTSNVEAEIKPWVENGIGTGYFYLNATDPNVEALQNAYNTHTGETWSEDEYNNLTTLLNAAIKMPETGYYRIKNKVRSNPYIGFGTETSWNKVGLVGCSEDAAIKDASTLIKLEKSGATYTLSTQGRYVAGQSSNSATFPTTTDESAAETFTIAPQVPGYAAFVSSNNGDGKGSLHHAGWGGTSGIVRWEAAADASQWALEEATELGNGEFALQIALNEVDGKYYATTCLPFPVSLSEEAYNVTLDGKKAIETAIGSDIPAGTPVLLMSETSPTLTATILNADPDDVDCGALKGVLIKTAVTDLEGETPVVLAAPNGKIGFFKLAEGASLSANRAYIAYEEGSSATPGSSKAFFENGFELGGSEVTGVEAIDNGQLTIDNSAVFNLQGQRVNKAQKGVYIQNGRKVVLK